MPIRCSSATMVQGVSMAVGVGTTLHLLVNTISLVTPGQHCPRVAGLLNFKVAQVEAFGLGHGRHFSRGLCGSSSVTRQMCSEFINTHRAVISGRRRRRAIARLGYRPVLLEARTLIQPY